jgi:hypothetical protein
VNGRGCPAGSTVSVSVDDVPVAQTRANADGRFSATFVAPNLPVGPHRLEARCGKLLLSAALRYAASTSQGSLGSTVPLTTLALLAAVVLMARPLLRAGAGRR